MKQHLDRVFGTEYEPDALHKLARNVYRQLGRLATEHARLLAAETTDIRDRITVIGDDHVAQARRQGKGVILVTGHFGYWELLGASVAALRQGLDGVARSKMADETLLTVGVLPSVAGRVGPAAVARFRRASRCARSPISRRAIRGVFASKASVCPCWRSWFAR